MSDAKIPNDFSALNPNVLKNISPPQINISQPSIPKFNVASENDCSLYEVCSKLQIANHNICSSGGDKRLRCTFGEQRIILLLSQNQNE